MKRGDGYWREGEGIGESLEASLAKCGRCRDCEGRLSPWQQAYLHSAAVALLLGKKLPVDGCEAWCIQTLCHVMKPTTFDSRYSTSFEYALQMYSFSIIF